MIKITLNNTQAVKSLQQIANQLEQPRRLYGILGETLKKIHTARFKAEQDPDGNNWKPLASSTLALKRKRGKSTKILRQDGYLADKTAYNVTSDNVEFGSQEVYARLHQFGGKAGRGKKVTVPARPWLGVGDKDEQLLLRKAEWHLGQIIGRMGK
ncbi:TPA: phage virion morphogenesis protein [Mannheimia haemolytica]|uniref:Mu-like prophage protein gpG n=1 Tax=Mannheimia haemolytica TaxID=75985 RepID=A0A249A3L7_MANHA|nr:phage virion morphogenesis protein [Mannheimia haemolytica]AWW72179.1 phage virion morphogenesis protein [Pasteurellaceae bacterium 12565]AGI33469.1 phage virion morphogenesis protein [Mannheimia haemolytica USDA-ARS-USMARC-183]AGK01614.1 phage virion morphogenesis protein S [Mannheimia haemolytica M42548]AGQ26430.1 phage morphogeneis protein [Mannheimia haemolytica D153]AGR74368.1 phage morphogeneis protein [Mannheimia haemolytica USMARC_2286]